MSRRACCLGVPISPTRYNRAAMLAAVHRLIWPISLIVASGLHAQTWTELAPAARPPARRSAEMAFDIKTGRAVLFGGEVGQAAGSATPANDTWLWDGTTWSRATPGNSPSVRRQHAMVYDSERGEIVLFGGMGADNGGLADTWVWNGTNWIQKSPMTSPPARHDHAMAYDPVRKRVVLFGGVTQAAVEGNDTWTWDGTNWLRMTPSVSPPGRERHGLAWDATRQVVVLYRGSSKADTWVWSGSTWMDQTTSANPGYLTEAVMVSHGGRVLIIGGFTNLVGMDIPTVISDQTWIWDGSSWRQLMISSAAPQATEAAGTWDPLRDRTLLFGGWQGGETVPSPTWSLAFGNGCVFTQAPPAQTMVPFGAGSIQLPVPAAAGCAWTASATAPWISLVNPAGNGTGTLTVSHQANSTAIGRFATVRVSGREYRSSRRAVCDSCESAVGVIRSAGLHVLVSSAHQNH